MLQTILRSLESVLPLTAGHPGSLPVPASPQSAALTPNIKSASCPLRPLLVPAPAAASDWSHLVFCRCWVSGALRWSNSQREKGKEVQVTNSLLRIFFSVSPQNALKQPETASRLRCSGAADRAAPLPEEEDEEEEGYEEGEGDMKQRGELEAPSLTPAPKSWKTWGKKSSVWVHCLRDWLNLLQTRESHLAL